MKKISLLIFILAGMSQIRLGAQDTLHTVDGTVIAQLAVIDGENQKVRYKLLSNPSGPVFVKSLYDVIKIHYASGAKDFIEIRDGALKIRHIDSPNPKPATTEPQMAQDQKIAQDQQTATQPQTQTQTAPQQQQQNAAASTDADYATLYIYRPKKMAGLAISYDLHLENEPIFRVKNNSKKTVKVTRAGVFRLLAETESTTELPISIKLGEEYYIRCGISMGVVVGRPKLELVDPETGKKEFEKIKEK